MDKAKEDGISQGGLMLSSWSSTLASQLETERTAWSSVLAVLNTGGHNEETASAVLSAAHQALSGPLRSKLLLLDSDGVVVVAGQTAAIGRQVPLLRNTLTDEPRLQSLRTVSLPWEPGAQHLMIAELLPRPIGGATVAAHFVAANNLSALAVATFGESNGTFTLFDPVTNVTQLVRPAGMVAGTVDEALNERQLTQGFSIPVEETGWLTYTVPLPNLGVSLKTSYAMEEALHYVTTSARPGTYGIAIVLTGMTWLILLGAVRGFYRSRHAQRNLEALVGLDPLTQLPNRRTFNHDLHKAIDETRAKVRVGLLFVDLDNFKFVNDTYGHEAGDDLLCEVARRLGTSVRKDDTVYRLGGDEFTVVLPGVESKRELAVVAERALAALAAPITLNGNTLFVSASVGSALAPYDAATSSQLVKCADLAVYDAKERGKACTTAFDSSLRSRAELRSTMSSDMRLGLSRGEFHIVYQPKINLDSGEVSGFEALMRWTHPSRGPVSPVEFIPVAEESSLILELGDFVIEQSIKQISDWRAEGNGNRQVAVNVSTAQLRDERAVNHIEKLLAHYGVPGTLLQVEVTETMLASDLDLAIWLISRLKQMGVSVAVDDFGTGYSSLSALQKFNVDYLKIDRSFVAELPGNRQNLEICKAVIDLAHALKVRVIAEGIETFGQYVVLQELGCDEAQGFFFSKPRSPVEAIAWKPNVVMFEPGAGDKF